MDVKEYRNMVQGRVNKAQGKFFEDQIEQACVYYRFAGTAYIEKNHEPFTVTRSVGKGQFIGHFARASQTDYTGVLKGGRAVCFEAKHTMTDRVTQDRVEPHQTEDLNEKEALGALCFVMAAIDDECYAIPWQTWKDMKKVFGHKYINKEDGQPFKVRKENGILLFLENMV